MSKLTVFILLFILVGGLMIYQESTSKTNFAKQFVSWLFGVGGNVKDVTTHAVTEYDWLPSNETGDSNG